MTSDARERYEAVCVAEFLNIWLAHVRERVRATTYEGYESLLRCHVPHELGPQPLTDVSPLDLQRMYAELLSIGTTAQEPGDESQRAHQAGGRDENPGFRVPFPCNAQHIHDGDWDGGSKPAQVASRHRRNEEDPEPAIRASRRARASRTSGRGHGKRPLPRHPPRSARSGSSRSVE